MVAMNPQTWDKDVAEIEPGGYLFYDSTKPLPPSKFRDDITVIGVPLTEICNATYTDPRQRQLFKNIIYVGALSALLDIDAGGDREADRRAVQGQGQADRAQRRRRCTWAATTRARTSRARSACRSQRADAVGDRIFVDGNSAAALGCGLWRRDGLRLVSDHAVVLARRGLRRATASKLPRRSRRPARTATPSSRPRTSSPRSAW